MSLQYLAPSLQFTPSGSTGSPAFSVRGIGTNTFDYSVEQSVGVVLDDVTQLLPRTNFVNTLTDIDQVEILRSRNLFDKHFVSIIFPYPLDPGAVVQSQTSNASRTVGVSFDAKFGK